MGSVILRQVGLDLIRKVAEPANKLLFPGSCFSSPHDDLTPVRLDELIPPQVALGRSVFIATESKTGEYMCACVKGRMTLEFVLSFLLYVGSGN